MITPLIKWEVRDAWLDPYNQYAVAGSALSTYVLTYSFGLLRIEYFSRIAFVITPLLLGLLVGGRRGGRAEADFHRLCRSLPIDIGRQATGRFAFALFESIYYLVLVSPLIIWYQMSFPHRSLLLAIGALSAIVLSAASIATFSSIALRWPQRGPYANGALSVLSFAAVSTVALLPSAPGMFDALMTAVPAVTVAKAADAFLDTKAAPLPALLSTVGFGLAAFAVARLTWMAGRRDRRATTLVVLSLPIMIVGTIVVASLSHYEPYSNIQRGSGSMDVSVIIDGVAEHPPVFLPVGGGDYTFLIRDSFNHASDIETTVVFESIGIQVDPSEVTLPPGEFEYEIPIHLEIIPNNSATDEVHHLHIAWRQDIDTRTADFLVRAYVPGFADPIPLIALASGIPIVVGWIRRHQSTHIM